MAEMKYKIGDRVIIEKSNVEGLFTRHAGLEGTIVDVDDSRKDGYHYKVADSENQFGVWCKVKHLVSEKPTSDKIVITHDGKTTTAALYREDGTKETATAKCAPEDKFDLYVGAKLALERLADKTAKPIDIELKGFKVGDRVNVDGMNGTVICIGITDILGVQFDDANYPGHRCRGIPLKAGTTGDKPNCWWVAPDSASHGEVTKYYNGKVVCITDEWCWWTKGKIYEVVNGTIIDDDRMLRYEDHPITPEFNGKYGKMFLPITESANG